MKKTFKQFVKDYDIDLAKCQLCSSETQLYEGSNIHVTYITLNKPVDGQDYLVLSEKLARIVFTKHDIKILREADAKYDEEHGWGLICHSTEITYDVDLSTVFSDTKEDSNVTFINNDDKEPCTIDLDKLKEVLYKLKDNNDTTKIYKDKYVCVIIDTITTLQTLTMFVKMCWDITVLHIYLEKFLVRPYLTTLIVLLINSKRL